MKEEQTKKTTKKTMSRNDFLFIIICSAALILTISSMFRKMQTYHNAEYAYELRVKDYNERVQKKNILQDKVNYLNSSYGKEDLATS